MFDDNSARMMAQMGEASNFVGQAFHSAGRLRRRRTGDSFNRSMTLYGIGHFLQILHGDLLLNWENRGAYMTALHFGKTVFGRGF